MTAARPLTGLSEFLESRWTRVVLAVLIIVSVLPYEALEETTRPFFLAVFGVELALRVLVVWRQRRVRAEGFFLLVDLLALVSFLPLGGLVEVEALRALRIARLLALVRFTRELAGDLWSVLTRREQLRQLGLVTAAVLALSFVAAVVLYHLAVPWDYDGIAGAPEGFWDRMWWSFRQVESPDNLVPHLHADPVLALVSLALTITGIFVFSYLIGLGANIVEQVVQAERRRPVAYRGHTLVVGPVHEGELLVREFVRIYDKNRALRRIGPREILAWLRGRGPRPRRHALPRMTLLAAPPEPPSYLYEPGMRWVVYRQGDAADPEALARVSAEEVKRAVLLAPEVGRENADAITLARLGALRAQNSRAHVFVEIRQSENEALAQAVGGEGTFVLDVPRFLGLFLCHHLLVPHLELLVGELLSASGSELYTHVFVDAREHRGLRATGETLSFEAMQRLAGEHGVTLCGVLVGNENLFRTPGELVPVDRLTPWVNPLAPPIADGLAAHGLEPLVVPSARFGGVFGISDTYLEMRRFARALLQTTTPEPAAPDPVATQLVDAIDVRALGVKRVWIVGSHPAARPLVDALAHFVEGVEIGLAIEGDEAAAEEQLSALGIEGEREMVLERGGRLRVHVWRRDVAREVARRSEGADAVVFLSRPDAADVDALTALRVLRFVREAEGDARLLVEMGETHRAAELERQVRRLGGERFEVTLLSTQQIRNYFMVHSAFVPGATAIYGQLLGSRGQELVYLPLDPDSMPEDRVAVGALRDALTPRACIPIALLTHDGLDVNPRAEKVVSCASLRGIFCVADLDDLGSRFPIQESSGAMEELGVDDA